MAVQNRNIFLLPFVAKDRRLHLLWRILLYVIGFFVIDVILSEVALAVAKRIGWQDVVGQAFAGFLLVPATLGFTYLFRRFRDRKPWRGMAVTPLRGASLFLIGGLALGGGTLGLVFLIEYALGWIQIVGTEVSVSGAGLSLVFVLAGLVFSAATGFIEELVMRGYIFQNLGRVLPLWLAILINGLLFGLLHFTQPEFGIIFVAQALLFTVMLVVFRLGTGTLWLAIGWHGGWNWLEDNVVGFTSANTPQYSHALLHLKLLGPAALVEPEQGPIGPILLLFTIVLFGLWVARQRRQIDWRVHLNDEGQIER